MHEGGEDPGLKARGLPGLMLAFAHLGDELDAVAEFAGQTNVHARKAADAAHRHGREGVVGAVGKLDEDGQLVGGVMAVDVQRGVGLGIAQFLRLLEGHVEVEAVARHLGEDVIARAVEDAHQRRDAVARQALLEGRHHGDGPGHAGLVAQDAPLVPGLFQQAEAFFGQQGLVGGNDMLAHVQRAVDDLPRRFDAAHELHEHVDLGIVRQGGRVGGELRPGGQGHLTRLARMAHQHFLDHHVAAAAAADEVRVLFKEAGQTAAHRAEAGQTDDQRFVALLRHRFSRGRGARQPAVVDWDSMSGRPAPHHIQRRAAL